MTGNFQGSTLFLILFLFGTELNRGVIDVDDRNYVLGEEEASWVLKLILPYLNELLSKLRALFSGDPGTTMKVHDSITLSFPAKFLKESLIVRTCQTYIYLCDELHVTEIFLILLVV